MTDKQHRNLVEHAWDLLAEPKSVTVIMTLCYVGLIVLGVWVVLDPGSVGVHDMMGVLLIVGGMCGVIGCPSGQWWIERAGLVGLAGAFTAHLVYVIGNSDPNGPFETASAVGVIVLCATRWLRIRALPMDPRRYKRGRDGEK